MRHNVYGKKLGRTKNERTALFRGLVQELFIHGNLTTSETKAKAIKGLIDKIINLAKSKNTQRLIQTYFTNKLLQERLITEIAPKLTSRVSGYTSVVKMGIREGDRTTMVKMSIIGQESLKPLEKVTGNRVQGTVKKVEEVKKVVVKKVVPAKKKVTKTK